MFLISTFHAEGIVGFRAARDVHIAAAGIFLHVCPFADAQITH